MNNGLSQSLASNISENNIVDLQTRMKKYQFLFVSFLIAIPVIIHLANKMGFASWKTMLVMLFMMGPVLYFYQVIQICKRKIQEACFQLSVGSKVYKKYQNKKPQEVYFIFQEGHRYYYLESMTSGEKRLVAKDKVFNDYNLFS